MIHPPARGVSRLAVVVAAGLVLAAPAAASEGPVGPPAGPPAGPPLANPLAPPTFTPPSVAPGTPPRGTKRPARPRVVKARVTPRRVGTGRSSRLRLSVSGAARVRVVIKGVKRGRATTRTVTVRGGTVNLRLPSRLKPGRYRVTVVALDAQGTRSQTVRRSFTVVRRGR